MKFGINGQLLEVDLTTRTISRRAIPESYFEAFFGGRGLGMRLLYDYLPGSGTDPFSPENPLLFVPGLLCGFPFPSASRTCMVTKSPITSPFKKKSTYASTVSYSNMGGFRLNRNSRWGKEIHLS